MIEVTHYYGIHQGGTKDYHLYLLYSKATKKHILVKRWGKTASEGQAKLEMGGGNGDAQLNGALKDRAKSGYDMRSQTLIGQEFPTVVAAFDAVLPKSVQRAFSNAQIAALDPGHDANKAAFDPLADQREEMRKKLEEAAEAKRAADEAEGDAILKSNPIYGMF
jgi:predicted DNA-binding WGR domain protein